MVIERNKRFEFQSQNLAQFDNFAVLSGQEILYARKRAEPAIEFCRVFLKRCTGVARPAGNGLHNGKKIACPVLQLAYQYVLGSSIALFSLNALERR